MNADTDLYRQIHPRFITKGHVQSRAFRPSSGDPRRLSVYDGDQIEAEEAWQHYTAIPENQSSGVMIVTVNECTSLSLNVIPDGIPYKEHAFIDFNDFNKKQIRNISKALSVVAKARGFLPEGKDYS